MFTDEQKKFMRSMGLNFNFDDLSDDEWIRIEDEVGDKLVMEGLDKDYDVNEIGKMCYSILDKIE